MSDAPRLTVAQALRDATRTLAGAGIEGAALDARRLMAHALGIDPARVILVSQEPLPAPGIFAGLVARRLSHEPVSKITGWREFYGRRFEVTPDVLDPRPETELLVDLALSESFGRALDLGCGSGCIVLSLAAERTGHAGVRSDVVAAVGVDISRGALDVARRNRRRLGLEGRVRLLEGCWYAPLDAGEQFDLIVANPPYIAEDEFPGLAPEVRGWDPRLALVAGENGLAGYRAILAAVPRRLLAGGRLIVEIGHAQGDAVAALFEGAGLAGVRVHPDLAGLPRAVSGRNG